MGKTFLVTETFGKQLDFDMTGVIDGNKDDQMVSFNLSLKESGYEGERVSNWYDAFEALKEVVRKKTSKNSPVIIFIDELPCLDTPRSGLVKALDLFWNGWANRQKNVKLIVCGSATTWMVKKIIKNKGGLHNRLNHRISLSPFPLGLCEKLIQSRGLVLSRKQILEAYMIFGGVPYYWSLLQKGTSITAEIDRLIFSPDGELHDEFFDLLQKYV